MRARSLRCPFCVRLPLREINGMGEGIEAIPGWSCDHCGVKFVVTNPSYLPRKVWKKHPTCKKRAIAHAEKKKRGNDG